jgi:hypothetical protein
MDDYISREQLILNLSILENKNAELELWKINAELELFQLNQIIQTLAIEVGELREKSIRYDIMRDTIHENNYDELFGFNEGLQIE